MNYTVEVAADVDGIPHSFLVVKDESGAVVYARGFAPEETGLWGVGKINDDIDHPFSNTSGTLAILDENGFNNLKTIISGYENNPPYYNLLLGSQCTVWTLQVLKEANILSFAPSTNFTMPLLDIVENLVFNPYFQAAYFKLKEIANDIVTAITPTQPSLNEIMETEYQLTKLYNAGSLDNVFYDYVTQEISNLIVTAPIIDVPNINDGNDGLNANPIGAFYESVTPANDPALSIADKTYVLLDSTNKGITASALASKDTNADGKLNGTELTGLNMWRDLNENGIADSGEITTLASQNITTHYSMYMNHQNFKNEKRVS